MNIGVNFFGPKRKLYRDLGGTLARLKADGINSAEVCVAFAGGGEPPEQVKHLIPAEVLREMSGGIWPTDAAAERLAAVRAGGMTVVSVHAMVGFSSTTEEVAALIPTLVGFGKANSVAYFVLSLMQDLDGIRPFAPVLNDLAAALAEVGIGLAYHNHEMECVPGPDGSSALDWLLETCPLLTLELDVGWAKFADADPVALMEKYRDRLHLLHLKDVTADACPANRDTCCTAVGEGSIPLAAILAAAGNCPHLHPHGIIIDQDDSLTDIMDDLAIGAKNIKKALS